MLLYRYLTSPYRLFSKLSDGKQHVKLLENVLNILNLFQDTYLGIRYVTSIVVLQR